LILTFIVLSGSARAQGPMIVQGSDGTTGTVVDLGNGRGIYSDPHGNRSTMVDLGGGVQSLRFTTPSSPPQSGTVHSFGSVPEPITPAPVLPFGPRVSQLLTPGSPKAPAVEPPLSSGSGTGFWKR